MPSCAVLRCAVLVYSLAPQQALQLLLALLLPVPAPCCVCTCAPRCVRGSQGATYGCGGLVKVLRKNVRELGSRTSGYVDQCIKLERELVQQVRVEARLHIHFQSWRACFPVSWFKCV
eukprot:1159973-Pelagomonas_calceolata.AAC.4